MFEMEVNANIASGSLDDFSWVEDAEGSCPIVVALGEEPLSLLVERITAEDGLANVFVKEGERVSMLVSTPGGTEVHPGSVDLSNPKEWANGNAPVSEFLDYLRLQKDGVVMPPRLPLTNELKLSMLNDDVTMEEVPVMV